jgi:hypothetical protein
VAFLRPGKAYLLALTCTGSAAAVHEVHKGVVPVRALRCFFSPRIALFNYACDNLKGKGESVRSDGLYWLVCAASRVSVDNAEDEAQALRVCGGSQLPYTLDEWMGKIMVESGQLGLLKWMCAQKPPCPCDFGVWSWQRKAGQWRPTSV